MIVNGRIMLHLGAWNIWNLVATSFGRTTDLILAQQPGQCGIPNLNFFLFGKFFMDPLNVTVTFPIKPVQKLRIDFVLVRSYCGDRLAFLIYNIGYRIFIDLKDAGNLPYPLAGP